MPKTIPELLKSAPCKNFKCLH